ncbi:hypothetical protein [Myroides phaeus]|uniref:hypothetical protein n=1 Tax=Myroides phaeus TaxID=702745 RepID=UPI001303E0F9|nr:hypothetical protein [Myroides phaeus]
MNKQLTNYEKANIASTCFVYNLLSFICSFIAIIISFIPFVNIIAFFLGCTALLFSILSYNKSKKINNKLTPSLFAIVISLFPITISIGLNLVILLALTK